MMMIMIIIIIIIIIINNLKKIGDSYHLVLSSFEKLSN